MCETDEILFVRWLIDHILGSSGIGGGRKQRKSRVTVSISIWEKRGYR